MPDAPRSPPQPRWGSWLLTPESGFALALAAGLIALQAPFLDRPVNYDEANFLTLARGAALNPWAPHDILINWQGKTERAFDVLSNPPGIAWFLAAVQSLFGESILAQRAAMCVWLVPTALGAVRLAAEFSPAREARLRAVGLAVMPMALMSGSALLPDGPLYALTLFGLAGLARASRLGQGVAGWAAVVGVACLFRYSAVCLLPLVLLLGGLGSLWAFVPLALLFAHDANAYGQPHMLAMGQFQSVSNTPADWGHKAASALTFLGGALVLPLYRWGSPQLLGAVLGAVVGVQFAPGGWVSVQAAAFGAAGGAALAPAFRALLGDDRDRWLGLWGAGGFAFLLLLRFTAARYWLPFAPAVLLLAPFGGVPAVAGSAVLGLALLADDEASARAIADLADRVVVSGARRPGGAQGGSLGMFTGHWGWQWALEQHGWKALDEGGSAPSGTLLAIPTEAWPQDVQSVCAMAVFEDEAGAARTWLPRAYSSAGLANLHANWIEGDPPARTVLPWTFASDPYERAVVCEQP